MKEKVRIPTIDALRGSVMLLVIYSHALEIHFKLLTGHGFDPFSFAVWRAFGGFRMAAFYFISGTTALGFSTRPLRKVLLTALSLIILADVTQLAFAPLEAARSYHEGEPSLAIVGEILKPLVTGSDYNLIIPWFLVSLAFVQILSWLHVRAGVVGKLAIWVGVIASYLVAHALDVSSFAIQTWPIGLAFLLLGREAMRHKLLARDYPWWSLLLVAAVTAAAVIALAPLNKGCAFDPTRTCVPPGNWYPGFTVEVLDGHFGFAPLFVTSAFLGTAMLVALALLLKRTAITSALGWVGRNTVTLIVVNGFVLSFVEQRISRALPVHPLSPLLTTAMTLAITGLQVAVIPLTKPAVTWLYHISRRFADVLLTQLGTVTPALKTETETVP